jgi:hypothetical protein
MSIMDRRAFVSLFVALPLVVACKPKKKKKPPMRAEVQELHNDEAWLDHWNAHSKDEMHL